MLALSGDLSCENCGMVQEENPIISEVQFGESSSGAAMVQGAMVGADQARANFSMRNAMESREQTLLSAKLKIKKLGSAMKIPEYIMESASGWFKLALVQNFVQGRRSQNVIAACLYVACRHEKTHHLLIDFSSRLQISVYSLGATYLKLVRALQIQKLPLADPSLFIQHFAERLGFGDQTAKVCRDATKIALQMASDWIYEGRRPAGIAGACLLLAARMNNFRRSHGEIVAIARVGEETIQKRLNELKKTDSATLTLTKFREAQTIESSLPPSFKQNRHIELKILNVLSNRAHMLKQYKKLASKNKLFDALFESETTSRPVAKLEANSEVASQKSDTENGNGTVEKDASKKKNDDVQVISDGDSSDEDDIWELMPAEPNYPPEVKNDRAYKPTTKRLSGLGSGFEDRSLRTRVTKPHYEENFEREYDATPAVTVSRKRRSTTAAIVQGDGLLKSVLAGGDISEREFEVALDHIWKNQQKALQQALYQIPLESQARELFVPEDDEREASPSQEDGEESSDLKAERLEQQIELNKPRNLVLNLATTSSLLAKISDDPNLDDVEDDEVIEEMILTPKMSYEKEKIWTALNHEFLIAQEKRILKQAADEIAGNTSGQQRKRRRIKDTTMDPVLNDAAVANAISLIGEDGKPVTPAESAKQLLQSKNFSRKINYSTIGDLFNK